MRHETDTQLSEDNDSDNDVKEMLGDAYDAPALPASLLQRLDHQIAREWGHSPELVLARPTLLGRSKIVAVAWLRVARIAVCVASG